MSKVSKTTCDPWLFDRNTDLLVFLLPALVAIGFASGAPMVSSKHGISLPLWLLFVVFVDVAHVWSTIYVTYLDREVLRSRPILFLAAPLFAYVAGVVLYLERAGLFWTALAYLAVFHFVRQQYGWVALYNRKDRAVTASSSKIDAGVVYLSTLVPLAYWHARLPRSFVWFTEGDFVHLGISESLVCVLLAVWAAFVAAFVWNLVCHHQRDGVWRLGKATLVFTTALCWFSGIVWFNDDLSFTATNVLIHGVPYFALVWVTGRGRAGPSRGRVLQVVLGKGRLYLFVLIPVVLAFTEEYLWDRLVWHERGALFLGPDFVVEPTALAFVVPLLAIPQATHYILDGFIWRRAR